MADADNSTINAEVKYRSFENPEVLLTTYDDSRLGIVSDSQCWYEKGEYTPTYLVIRSNATDEQLIKVATRFNLSVDSLKAYRSEKAK